MLCVPSSLEGLLVLLAPCFTRPTFRTFRAMVVGQISQTGLRTVTGMLVGARLSGVWHHARAHRFFSHARWSTDDLGLRLLEVIVARLCEPGAPLTVPVDDTLLHRLGRRVHVIFWHHDRDRQRRPVGGGVGQQLGRRRGARAAAVHGPHGLPADPLPPLAAQAQAHPQGQARPVRPSKPDLAREMVDLIAARFPDRRLHVVGDSAYGSGAWRGLGAHVTLTVRPRKDAALYKLAPPRTGKQGRPALKGARLPSLAQIALDPATAWQQVTARRYGKTEQVEVHAFRCLWHGALGYTPVQVVLVRDTTKPAGYQLALLSTDLAAAAAELVERYGDRWPIEVCFEEGKQLAGVGHARNRTQRAVERTVPFQFLCMTLTILWYALHGHHPGDVAEHRARAPWYQTKTNPSFADILAKLRRAIIAAQCTRSARAPHRQKTTAIQQAWEAALG